MVVSESERIYCLTRCWRQAAQTPPCRTHQPICAENITFSLIGPVMTALCYSRRKPPNVGAVSGVQTTQKNVTTRLATT